MSAAAVSQLILLDAPIDIGGAEAQRRALEILAKAKYLHLPGWLERLLDHVGSLLGRFLDAVMSRPLVSGQGLNWPLLVVVLVVVGLGVLIVWRVGVPRRAARKPGPASVRTDPTVAPQDYRARADRAAEAGDLASAITERFRGITRMLEELTVLEPRPSRTAVEVARLAGALLPDVARQLSACAALFGEVSYGGSRGRTDDYDRLVGWDAEISRAGRHQDLAASAGPARDRPTW